MVNISKCYPPLTYVIHCRGQKEGRTQASRLPKRTSQLPLWATRFGVLSCWFTFTDSSVNTSREVVSVNLKPTEGGRESARHNNMDFLQ